MRSTGTNYFMNNETISVAEARDLIEVILSEKCKPFHFNRFGVSNMCTVRMEKDDVSLRINIQLNLTHFAGGSNEITHDDYSSPLEITFMPASSVMDEVSITRLAEFIEKARNITGLVKLVIADRKIVA